MADDSYTPEFDTPAGLPGFDLNAAVPGAYASPEGGGPVTDTVENRANISSGTAALGQAFDPRAMDPDNVTADMPQGQTSGFEQDMTSLGSNWQAGIGNLSGLTAAPQASIPAPAGMPTAEPDTTPAPNPASYSTAPADSGWMPAYNPAGGPAALPTASPAPVPNYSSPGIPDPQTAAYTPAGSPTYGGAGGPADATMGPVGAPSAGQPPGMGPMDSSAPGQGAGGAGGAGGAAPSAPGDVLSASVPNANDSLTAAVASAASGAGPHAALIASTVTLLMGQATPGDPNVPGTVTAGGSGVVGRGGITAATAAFGSEGGRAPQFANNDTAGWFSDAVNSWMAANPPQPIPPPAAPTQPAGQPPGTAPAPMPGEGSPDPAPAPDAGPPMPLAGSSDLIPNTATGQFDVTSPTYAGPIPGMDTGGSTNQTVGSAVMGQVDTGLSRFSPGYQANQQAELPSDQQTTWDRLANGSNDMWSSPLGGISDVASSEAAGQDDNIWKSPLGGIGPDPEADARDDIDPVTGKPNYTTDPNDDIWNSPLGGIHSVASDWASGNQMPNSNNITNTMMTL
jgi:hypothetical protein